MYYPYISFVFSWLCRFVYVQYFLMLVSLPILIGWGLPFSMHSALGNLIFTPLITLFLLASCLLFFCTLLNLPCTIPLWLCEQTASVWHGMLSYAQRDWLIGCPHAAWFITVGPLLVACILLKITQHASGLVKALSMFGAFCTTCVVIQLSAWPMQKVHTIPCNNDIVTLIMHRNQVTVVDPGSLGGSQSASSWTQYTLAPELVRTTGKTKIDNFVVLRANQTTLKAIISLHKKIRINNLYLPCTIKTIAQDLTDVLASLPINVVFLEDVTVTIGNADQCIGEVVPLVRNTRGKNNRRVYYVFQGIIDNKSVIIYPSDHTKRCKKKV